MSHDLHSGQNYISGPKVENEMQRNRFLSYFELSFSSVYSAGQALIPGFLFCVMVLYCFSSVNINFAC